MSTQVPTDSDVATKLSAFAAEIKPNQRATAAVLHQLASWLFAGGEPLVRTYLQMMGPIITEHGRQLEAASSRRRYAELSKDEMLNG